MKTKPYAYIASPLNHQEQSGIEANMKACEEYMRYVDEHTIYHAKALHYLPIFDDTIPEEREIALKCGFELLKLCDVIIVCGDCITKGMRGEIINAVAKKSPVLVAHKGNLYTLKNEYSDQDCQLFKFMDIPFLRQNSLELGGYIV